MKQTLYFSCATAISVLFGLAIALIEPYPNEHGVAIWCVSAFLYLVVAVAIANSRLKYVWLWYGGATFVCFGIAYVWFWFGAMARGWWYPPQLPIVQQFFYVDGEASYDASVANLFLAVWLVVSGGFAVYLLPRRIRTQSRESSSN